MVKQRIQTPQVELETEGNLRSRSYLRASQTRSVGRIQSKRKARISQEVQIVWNVRTKMITMQSNRVFRRIPNNHLRIGSETEAVSTR